MQGEHGKRGGQLVLLCGTCVRCWWDRWVTARRVRGMVRHGAWPAARGTWRARQRQHRGQGHARSLAVHATATTLYFYGCVKPLDSSKC